MKYMGSKTRIANKIIPLMKIDGLFYDVCCGGGNMIDKVKGQRIGIDIDKYAIAALELIRDNVESLPKNRIEADEIMYAGMKNSLDVAMKGYYGFNLSYCGKWFGGYRRDSIGKRDYINEAYRNSVKQSKNLQGVKFICADYEDIDYDINSVIYCDPPYASTTKYKSSFDHIRFWNWARGMSLRGYRVFVSEYTAPEDFIPIWSTSIASSLTRDTGSRIGKECLFIHESGLMGEKK